MALQALLPYAIPTIASLLGGLLGGKGQYEMSSQQKWLFDKLKGEYEGGIPDWLSSKITEPYTQLGQGIKQRYARQPAKTGLESAEIQRQVTTPQARTLGEVGQTWKMGLLNAMRGVAGGQQYIPSTTGGSLGNISYILALLNMMKGKGGGEGFDWMDILNPMGTTESVGQYA